MTEPFHFSTTYILDKSHYTETYEESSTNANSKAGYIKAGILALVGLTILLVTDINPYIAWFIIALGALEALSVRFQKSWWLARQMISKAANNKVTLTIDDQHVMSHSIHVDSKIAWANLHRIEPTKRGWLLYHSNVRFYLSNRCLSDEAQAFIRSQASLLADSQTDTQTGT